MLTTFLNFHGFSIGFKDTIRTPNIARKTMKAIDEMQEKIDELLVNTANALELEHKICVTLGELSQFLYDEKDLDPLGGIALAINSGSKGNSTNALQIKYSVGQQTYNGRRSTLDNECWIRDDPTADLTTVKFRTLCKFSAEESVTNIKARGFVENPFSIGLDPVEYVMHGRSVRYSICHTSIGTQKTGDLNRRLNKLVEDVHTDYGGRVVDHNNNIVSWNYGNDGIDPTKCIQLKLKSGKEIESFMDVRHALLKY